MAWKGWYKQSDSENRKDLIFDHMQFDEKGIIQGYGINVSDQFVINGNIEKNSKVKFTQLYKDIQREYCFKGKLKGNKIKGSFKNKNTEEEESGTFNIKFKADKWDGGYCDD